VPVLLNCLPIQSPGCRDYIHAPIFDRKLKLPVNQLSFVYWVHSKKTAKRIVSEKLTAPAIVPGAHQASAPAVANARCGWSGALDVKLTVFALARNFRAD